MMNDQLLLEYIFFHQEPRNQFKQFLQDRQVKLVREEVDETDLEAYVVYIVDDLDDAVLEQVESFYDDMMDLSESLVIQDEDASEMTSVGLAVSLNDGRSVLATIDPDVLNRVLTVISHDEFGKLVDAIADAVENPDDRPLCKR